MIKTVLLLTGILLVGYPIAWVFASHATFGDVEFGYFKGFNIVRHAIERSQCASSIEYAGVNQDLVLEEFHFKVTCRSGQVVRFWFDDSNMDVRRLCSRPAGLILWNRNERGDTQVYSIERLSQLLNQADVSDVVGQVLCNSDNLRSALRNADGDQNEILKTDEYCWDYLRMDFPGQYDLTSYNYTSLSQSANLTWP